MPPSRRPPTLSIAVSTCAGSSWWTILLMRVSSSHSPSAPSTRRIDKARQTLALRRARQVCWRQLSFLRFSNPFHVIFASISAMRRQGDGTTLGKARATGFMKVSF